MGYFKVYNIYNIMVDWWKSNNNVIIRYQLNIQYKDYM